MKVQCDTDTVTMHSIDILAVTKTHIRQDENDSLLHSITPSGFNFCQKPHIYGRAWWWHLIFHQQRYTVQIDLWTHLLSVPLKLLVLQLGPRLNR